ncbi:hypothetical protein ACHAW6_014400 [Cyclotella cf. meneghiniana]
MPTPSPPRDTLPTVRANPAPTDPKRPKTAHHPTAMSFALARTALFAARRQAAAASTQQAKRRMGSGAAAPEWTGIDKVVRGYFPQDDQRECFARLASEAGGGIFWMVPCMEGRASGRRSLFYLATAILGGYFGLFLLVKIKLAFSGAPVEAAPVAAAPSAGAGAIPDVDSEEFGAFLESEENVNKLIESWEK